MKGFSVSEVILSRQPVEDLQIDRPDWLVISSEEGLAKIRALVPQARCVLARRGLDVPRADTIFADLPGIQAAETTLALAAAAVRDILPAEALSEAVRRFSLGDGRERLLAAVQAVSRVS